MWRNPESGFEAFKEAFRRLVLEHKQAARAQQAGQDRTTAEAGGSSQMEREGHVMAEKRRQHERQNSERERMKRQRERNSRNKTMQGKR